MCKKRKEPLCSAFCDTADEKASASSEPWFSALPEISTRPHTKIRSMRQHC